MNSLFGWHAVNAVLQTKPDCVQAIYMHANRDDARAAEVIALAEKHACDVRLVSAVKLKEMVGDLTHQGVVALCEHLPDYTEKHLDTLLEKNSSLRLLVLDGVQDPHNLGAILRTAAAFAVDCVIAPKDNACSLTPVVRKVACGGAEAVPFVTVTNLARVMKQLQQQGVWFVGLDGQASETFSDIDLSGSVGLVMGNEGSGLRRLTAKHCDYLVKIHMPGAMESLNVSVATGIALHQLAACSI